MVLPPEQNLRKQDHLTAREQRQFGGAHMCMWPSSEIFPSPCASWAARMPCDHGRCPAFLISWVCSAFRLTSEEDRRAFGGHYGVAFVPLSGLTLKARLLLVCPHCTCTVSPPGLGGAPWCQPDLPFVEGLCFGLTSELGTCLFPVSPLFQL